MKLFYIAHAGGSANLLYKWSNGLEDFIEPIPLELAGHGLRYSETVHSDFKGALEDIFYNFKANVGDDDYVIVGHSMGVTLAYELYYQIENNNLKAPLHIFFSGSKPPRTRLEHEKIHMLEDEEFLNVIKTYGGLSNEMIRIKKFRKLFTPLLKADYKILEDYKFTDGREKIKCNISVMYGKEDLSFDNVKGWSKLANVCTYKEFEGGHFYIEGNAEKFTAYINKTILEECNMKN